MIGIMKIDSFHLLREMKQFVILHAKVLGISHIVVKLLEDINTLDENELGNWGEIFYEAGLIYQKKKKYKIALGLYNIARFPFPKTNMQYLAYQAYRNLFFQQYCNDKFKLEKLSTFNGLHKFYVKHNKGNQIVVICGGILSLKEQWINFVPVLFFLGFTVILTEMPAVGRNLTKYNQDAFNMFSEILEVVDPEKKKECHVIGLSFSGYLALQNSYIEQRIKGITMVGTPIWDLYHDFETFSSLPIITKMILTNNLSSLLSNFSDKDIFDFFDINFLLPNEKNKKLNIFYVQSQYDEVISLKEAERLEDICSNFFKLNLMDVHGSPNYQKTVIFYIIWSVLYSFNKRNNYVKVMIAISKIYYKYKLILSK